MSCVDTFYIKKDFFYHLSRPSPNIRGNVPSRNQPRRNEPNRNRSKPSNNAPAAGANFGGNYGQRPARSGDRGSDRGKQGQGKKKACTVA